MPDELEGLEEAEDGLNSDPIHDPAAKLLLEAPLEKGRCLLLVEGGCGRLAAHFATRFQRTLNHNLLYRDHTAALAWTGEKGVRVECVLSDIPKAGGSNGLAAGSSDAILHRLGRGTAQVNAVLIESFKLLRHGGVFWVSGHNKEGIKSFVKRAEAHFGNSHLFRIKSSCRLVGFKKETEKPAHPIEDPHYFDPVDLEIEIPKVGKLTYVSKPGIFSYRTTDTGTALLARHLPDCTGKSVLDLGCGSGVLSLTAGKLGAASILATDANVVASECAARNFEKHQLPGKTLCTHLTEGITEEFDIILSNPPFHQGHATDYSLSGKILDAIVPRLKAGGSVYLVANRFLDYATQGSARSLKVEVLAREQGYCVYRIGKLP